MGARYRQELRDDVYRFADKLRKEVAVLTAERDKARAEVAAQATEIERLKNAAKSRIKCPEGHAPGASRGLCWHCDAKANADELAALRAQPGEVTLRDDDWECHHGTSGRMVVFTSCFWCRGKK